MLIWLASYPRWGGRLLRQILYDTMKQVSYHMGADGNEIQGAYSRQIDNPLDEFVKEASRTRELVFVKTHLPSTDAFPRVVRRPGTVERRSPAS